MADYNVWSKTNIDIGTAGAAQVVSAVTKAAPPVMTYVGTDPANGDFIKTADVLGISFNADAH